MLLLHYFDESGGQFGLEANESVEFDQRACHCLFSPAIRPSDGRLMLNTMMYSDEVVEASEIPGLESSRRDRTQRLGLRFVWREFVVIAGHQGKCM